VLPKSANETRIRSNFEIIELKEEEFRTISKVGEGKNTRFVNPKGMFGFDVSPISRSIISYFICLASY